MGGDRPDGGRLRGAARFSTGLHRIVYRLAIDRAARLARRRAHETGIEEVAEIAAAPAAPAGAEEIGPLMEGLSGMQRAVVTLFYAEDRSVLEVSATLGLPTGTVKTHLSLARAVLREAWLKRRRAEESR